jgi:Rrf2 family transcriptional regulator, cysteine metabolism repressor
VPLQLSTRGRYGVRLMVALALKHEGVTGVRDASGGISLLREVARQEGISEKYLGQIIIPLRASGLVASHRGAHGGYSLGRPPSEITVKDVVEAIEGAIAPVPCVDPAAGASKAECAEDADGSMRSTSRAATRVWRTLHDQIVQTLGSFTLQTLAREALDSGQPVENYVI